MKAKTFTYVPRTKEGRVGIHYNDGSITRLNWFRGEADYIIKVAEYDADGYYNPGLSCDRSFPTEIFDKALDEIEETTLELQRKNLATITIY